MMGVGLQQYLLEWWAAVLSLPQILRRLAFKARTVDEELQEATAKGSLKRALSFWDLLALGISLVIGSGVFFLTGQAARTTGPAVVVSYLLSGFAATLAATCYAEFSVEYPVAGEGFTYIMITFGELPAWVTVTNLLLEYVLSTAAIARGFTQYLARLAMPAPSPTPPTPFNPDEDLASADTEEGVDKYLRVAGNLDFLAFGVVLLMSAVLCTGVRESTMAIVVLTVIQLLLLGAVIIAGFTQADTSNLSPFVVGGIDNLCTASAILFFNYAGFDVVASAAEEARKVRNVPRALLGTTILATVVYVLMSLSLVMMVPTPDIQLVAPFAKAFATAGLTGMYYVVCVTALIGTIGSMLTGLYGTARIAMVAARDWLLPPFLATIYPRTQTPVVAQLVFGVITAALALACTFTTLSDLVSIATLLVTFMVANALLFRRYFPGLPRLRYSRWGTVEAAEGRTLMPFEVPGARLGLSLWARQWLVVGHMVLINGFCIALTVYFQVGISHLDQDPGGGSHNSLRQWWGEIVFFGLWVAATLSFQLLCPLEYEPPKWHIPWWLMPWLPSTTLLLVTFIAASLSDRSAYVIFACWIGATLLVYLFFSLPMSYMKHVKLDQVNAQMNVVELTYQNGRWQEPQSSFKLQLTPTASRLTTIGSGLGWEGSGVLTGRWSPSPSQVSRVNSAHRPSSDWDAASSSRFTSTAGRPSHDGGGGSGGLGLGIGAAAGAGSSGRGGEGSQHGSCSSLGGRHSARTPYEPSSPRELSTPRDLGSPGRGLESPTSSGRGSGSLGVDALPPMRSQPHLAPLACPHLPGVGSLVGWPPPRRAPPWRQLGGSCEIAVEEDPSEPLPGEVYRPPWQK